VPFLGCATIGDSSGEPGDAFGGEHGESEWLGLSLMASADDGGGSSCGGCSAGLLFVVVVLGDVTSGTVGDIDPGLAVVPPSDTGSLNLRPGGRGGIGAATTGAASSVSDLR
jgi:hypothetical protein